MANWRASIIYFRATGAGASLNENQGVWVHTVYSVQEAADYIAETANVNAAVARYGQGGLGAAHNVEIPVTVVDGLARVAQPHQAWYNENTDTMHHDPLIVAYPFRKGFQALHDRFEYLSSLVDDVHHNYAPDDVNFVRAFLHAMDQGAYAIWHKPLSEMNIQNKALWLREYGKGPADTFSTGHARAGEQIYNPADPETIAELVAGLREAGTTLAVTGAVSVVNWKENPVANRWTLLEMLDAANSPSPFQSGSSGPREHPTVAELDRGRWIAGINA